MKHSQEAIQVIVELPEECADMGEMLSKKNSDIKTIHQEYLLKKLASIKPEPNMLKIVATY